MFLGYENSQSLEITNVITTLMSYTKTDEHEVETVESNNLHSTVNNCFLYSKNLN